MKLLDEGKAVKIALSNTNKTPYPIPEGHINGGLWITGRLADGFVERNINVDFYTGQDTKTTANKISGDLYSYFHYQNEDKKNYTVEFLENKLLTKLVENSNKNIYNIINIHNTFSNSASIAHLIKRTPVIFTLHDPISHIHEKWSNTQKINHYFICISKYQENQALKAGLKNTFIIYDGLDISNFEFKRKVKKFAIFFGRIDKQKGYDIAIEAAIKTGIDLKIAGRIKDDDKLLIEKKLLNFRNKKIDYLGSLEHSKMSNILGEAKVFIFPLQWEEPFGLTMIEAMACGTPVIAFARGSIPEIIKDGVTGLIVNSSENDKRGDWIIKKTGIEGLIKAANKIYAMPEAEYQQMRLNCRKHVEQNFTVEKMVDNYEKVYKQVITNKLSRINPKNLE